jgi:hypothetical protein
MAVAGTVSATVVVTDSLGATATESGQAQGTNQPPTLSLSGDTSCHPRASRTSRPWPAIGRRRRRPRLGRVRRGQTARRPPAHSRSACGGRRARTQGGRDWTMTTFDVLNAQAPGCSSVAAVGTPACRLAANRFCAAQPGYVGGYGPVEYSPTKCGDVRRERARLRCRARRLPTRGATTPGATHRRRCRVPAAPPRRPIASPTDTAAASDLRLFRGRPATLHGGRRVARGGDALCGPSRPGGGMPHPLRRRRSLVSGPRTTSAGRRATAPATGFRGDRCDLRGVPAVWTLSSRGAEVTVTADDNRGGVVTRTATVQTANALPGSVTVSANPTSCTVPCTVTFTAAAVDPDLVHSPSSGVRARWASLGTTATCGCRPRAS